LQGLDGVGALEKALLYLQAEAARPYTLSHEDNALLVIDAKGQSVLRCAATVVELAVAKAMRSGQAELRIHQCHNRLLLLGYLSRAAVQGLHVQARWEDARHCHLADFTAGIQRPALRSEARPGAGDTAEQSVTVLFSRPGQTALAPANPQSTLQQGYTVNEHTWQRLKQLAEHILVESTDTSRRHGAGGGSDAD